MIKLALLGYNGEIVKIDYKINPREKAHISTKEFDISIDFSLKNYLKLVSTTIRRKLKLIGIRNKQNFLDPK